MQTIVSSLSSLLPSDAQGEDETESKPPAGQRRPSIPRLPSQVLESDDSASTSTSPPPSISFSPTLNDSPTFSRTSTVELDDEEASLSGATTPLKKSASLGTSSSSPSTVEGYRRHRRGWSQSVPKEVKETLDVTSSEDPEKGTRKLNQYQLDGEELGKGSFGYVWRAVDSQTGEEFAIKEFSKSRLRRHAQAASMRAARRKGPRSPQPKMQEDDGMRLIEHEVAIMKKLKHINILALREVIDDKQNDSIYMVLELCKGGPILEIATTEDVAPLDETLAKSYFRQVLLALEYLHHQSICHHDIKPDNILIKSADDGLIKLCDFGVSQLFARAGDDLSSRNAGSPAFLSPELNISHHGQLHQRASDVWALGVTLYAMLTGRLPFRSTNSLELAELIQSEPAVIPRSLAPEARDILSKMLNKDPETRIDIDGLREHPWTTENGESPLPSKEENVEEIQDPTNEEVANALRSLSGAASAVRIAQRIRRMVAARRAASTEGRRVSDSPPSVAAHQDDQNVDTMRFVEDKTGFEYERSEVKGALSRRSSGSAAKVEKEVEGTR